MGFSYKKMRTYFDNPEEKEKTEGFYNRDIVHALNTLKITLKVLSIRKHGKKYFKTGTIVFIGSSRLHPRGHFFLKTNYGWMDSWINYLELPVQAGFRKNLPGEPKWVILTN
jgi:hypothetical protein